MFADHRIARISESKFLQSSRTSRRRMILNRRQRKKSVENNCPNLLLCQLRRNRFCKKTRTACRQRNRHRIHLRIRKKRLLPFSTAVNQRKKLPIVDRRSLSLKRRSHRIRERKIEIIPAEQNMIADADPVQLQISISFPDSNQTEISRSTADITDQHTVARRNLFAPAITGFPKPRVKSGQRFLKQSYLRKTGRSCRFPRQSARNFVK